MPHVSPHRCTARLLFSKCESAARTVFASDCLVAVTRKTWKCIKTSERNVSRQPSSAVEKVNLLLRRKKSTHDVTRRVPTIQRYRMRTIYSPHGTCPPEIRAPFHSSTSCDVGGARAHAMLNRDRPCDDEQKKTPWSHGRRWLSLLFIYLFKKNF